VRCEVGKITTTEFDLLIIGGGLVGASLACALTGQGLRIGLVEAAPLATGRHPSYDDRVLALAYGSRRIFEGLGLWDAIAADATPILTVHISEQGAPGIARLSHRDEGVAALGYVAEARLLARQAMGLAGYLPRLAQGLPLLAGDAL